MDTSYFNRFPALKYRDFRLLWFGQFISNAGSQMQVVAVNWHIYILTGSAVALGMIGLFRVIPIIIFSLIGGSVADVYNRKKILLYSQIALTVLSGILAASTILHHVSAITIYIITVLSAVALAFSMPAQQAIIPNLVNKKHLENALSLNVILRQVATIAGPAIAGFLIAKLGVGMIYGINAISFFAVITALLLMKNTGDIVSESAKKMSLESVKEGLQFVVSQTIIWSTMILDFFSTFFASATALLPIYAKDILHVGPQGLGILYAAPSIGALIAGFAIAHMGSLKRQGEILLFSIAAYAVGTILFGFSKIFLVSLIGLFVIGAGDSISTIIRNTIRQVVTPDRIRGRMTAINMIFFMGGPQLGEFEAGVLAAWVGAPLSVVTGGVATLVVVGAVAAFVPLLRNYRGLQK